MSNKENEIFTVNLTGLKLSEKQLEEVNKAIQKAVLAEIAKIDPKVKTDSLTTGGFENQLRGIIYVPKE